MQQIASAQGPRNGNVGRVITACTAAAALAVLALLVVRASGWDSDSWLAIPMAFLPYATAVTVGAVLVCAVARRLSPGLVAIALLVVQLAWLVPPLVPTAQSVPLGAARLRVATVNTHASRVDAVALVTAVREDRLDVLAVEELAAAGIRALDEAGIRAVLPHAELHPETDTSLYSRLPLTDAGLLHQPTTWPQTTATVRAGGWSIQIIGIHTYLPKSPRRWTRDLRALRAAARNCGPDIVMLGDFNATLDHAPMRALLDAGLTDTAAELGRGWAPTWPSGHLIPPLIAIDHVLHGSGLRGVSASERNLPGTDHRMVIAELAIVPR